MPVLLHVSSACICRIFISGVVFGYIRVLHYKGQDSDPCSHLHQDRDDPIRFSNETCGVTQPPRATRILPAVPHAVFPAAPPSPSASSPAPTSPLSGSPPVQPPAKRPRTSSSHAAALSAAPGIREAVALAGEGAQRPVEVRAAAAAGQALSGAGEGRGGDTAAAGALAPAVHRVNPIDHIFQFHKARLAWVWTLA